MLENVLSKKNHKILWMLNIHLFITKKKLQIGLNILIISSALGLKHLETNV